MKEAAPKEEGGMGEAPEVLVGGCTRVRIEVRTGMVSSIAGERWSGRLLDWAEVEGLVEWGGLRDEEKEGVVAIVDGLWLDRSFAVVIVVKGRCVCADCR